MFRGSGATVASIIISLYIYKRALLDEAKIICWIDSVELLYSAILKVNSCVNLYVVLNQVQDAQWTILLWSHLPLPNRKPRGTFSIFVDCILYITERQKKRHIVPLWNPLSPFLYTSFFKVTLLKLFNFRGQINHKVESNIDDVKLRQGYRPGLHSASFVLHLNWWLSSCSNTILFPSIQEFSITLQTIVWLHK